MKGDYTRFTFDPAKHFSRVLEQQGRVRLDADGNEQTAILLHVLRTLAADLIGPHGGPSSARGFEILATPAQIDALGLDAEEAQGLKDLLAAEGPLIGRGRYYVAGVLCENEGYPSLAGQDDLPGFAWDPDGPSRLAYLDVWERHVSHAEDEAIREPALGGVDTAARAKVVWQVRLTAEPPEGQPVMPATRDELEAQWPRFVELWQPPGRGRLKARARIDPKADEPCLAAPGSRYRGPENQLYRVEIHRGGTAWGGTPVGKAGAATFKWSRENGSVVFPVRGLAGEVATLDHLGRDERSSLAHGDWVELADDASELGALSEPRPLLKVARLDPQRTEVTLEKPQGSAFDLPDHDETEARQSHALLRRWDHREGERSKGGLTLSDGAALVVEGEGESGWLVLEDGIEVQFQPGATYRAGDYWLIPARTATGDVEWPGGVGAPDAVPPHGVEHHYAPLALLPEGAALIDLRREFKGMTLP